eukprot:TRINITY_DN33017_c0_g1_i1.p2 TRINITY_DN33017_c0_g1~~TRINITY_DN33017_c0_g1_i1.p2  ORF type:complete len:135 (+),score=35.72 TRINITY_DN33017_c0_g1_i1:97-501(+)
MAAKAAGPFEHLRYRYPETWKRLITMQNMRIKVGKSFDGEVIADSMQLQQSLPALPPKGMKLQPIEVTMGELERPSLASGMRRARRSKSDVLLGLQRQQKAALNGSGRNDSGAWFEAPQTGHRINHDYRHFQKG